MVHRRGNAGPLFVLSEIGLPDDSSGHGLGLAPLRIRTLGSTESPTYRYGISPANTCAGSIITHEDNLDLVYSLVFFSRYRGRICVVREI